VTQTQSYFVLRESDAKATKNTVQQVSRQSKVCFVHSQLSCSRFAHRQTMNEIRRELYLCLSRTNRHDPISSAFDFSIIAAESLRARCSTNRTAPLKHRHTEQVGGGVQRTTRRTPQQLGRPVRRGGCVVVAVWSAGPNFHDRENALQIAAGPPRSVGIRRESGPALNIRRKRALSSGSVSLAGASGGTRQRSTAPFGATMSEARA